MTETVGGTRPLIAPGTPRREWYLAAALVALAFVPVAAGGVRLGELAGGALETPANARFVTDPVPVVLHVVAVTTYSLLAPFQFVPGFRRRRPRWHRVAGRILAPAGIVVALTGVWMTLTYDLPAVDRGVVDVVRIGVGSAMAASIGLGLLAVRRRDFTGHRAWMIRGYALGMGAGTQVFTTVPWLLLLGEQGPAGRAFSMIAGWVVNVVVAEWVIRRAGPGPTPPGARPRAEPAVVQP
jgi:Predicted membrane protein (DUF2306)